MRERDERWKLRQKSHYDRRNGVKPLPDLQQEEPVMIKLDNQKDWQLPAKVVEKCGPRSYKVQTPTGQLRRNRRHLRPTSEEHYAEASAKLRSSVGQQLSTPATPTCSSTGPEIPLPTSDQPETPEAGQDVSTDAGTSSDSPPRRTRSGRQVVKPARYRE